MVRMGRGETMSPGVLPWHMDAVAERYAQQDGQTLQAAGQACSSSCHHVTSTSKAAIADAVLDQLVSPSFLYAAAAAAQLQQDSYLGYLPRQY